MYRVENETHGAPPRSGLLTILRSPSRMPTCLISPSLVAPVITMRTQPFSITKLKALTVSSIGTNRVLLACGAKVGPRILACWVGSVGENDVHIVKF